MSSKKILASLVAAAALAVAPLGAVADDYMVVMEQGSIHQVDYGSNSIVISGVSYGVALDASVSIAGSYGAFTMLQQGMNVEFEYRVYDDTHRVITDISEMRAGEEPEQF